MKTRINNKLVGITYCEHTDADIYIMDFQERTQTKPVKRSIETSNTCFAGEPLLLEYDTQPLHIQNGNQHEVQLAIFPCNVFGIGIKHSECCAFTNHHDSFALFVEIKDCKLKNVSSHFSKSKQQILDTVKEFRDRGVIHSKQKVYAVISFPRKTKLNFDNHLFYSPINTKQDFLDKNIIIAGTNNIKVVDQTIIEHIL